MNLKHKNRAWCVVQHLNINYIHVETPQVENYKNNDYEIFKSQGTHIFLQSQIFFFFFSRAKDSPSSHSLCHRQQFLIVSSFLITSREKTFYKRENVSTEAQNTTCLQAGRSGVTWETWSSNTTLPHTHT